MKKVFYVILLVLFAAVIYYFYPENQLEDGVLADHIRVEKSLRKMTLFFKGKELACYAISLGGPPPFFNHPKGPKTAEGDYKTPEGNYVIDSKKIHSLYHRSLHINYPNSTDKKLSHTGGGILIHGLNKEKNQFLGKFMRWIDWTKGCIAVTNSEIEEIYKAVPIGCNIQILP
jgi:murein L,D-transpeptidase YafK